MKKITFRGAVSGLKSTISKLVVGVTAMLFVATGALAQEAEKPVEGASPQAAVTPETVMALEKRVKMLEAQIVDLRAMIGTFSSMGKHSGAGLQRQSGDQGAGRPSSHAPSSNLPSSNLPSSNLPWQGADPQTAPREQQGLGRDQGGAARDGSSTALPVPGKRPDMQEDGFASDRLASRGEGDNAGADAVNAPSSAPESTDAQSLYKDAYSHMLRRDYASAESAFGALLKNHPQSRMAGNAQYWIGETYYVRGKYRPAADAFLKAYRNYSNGVKAPDSLMKLALSLTRLGQKGAACKTFEELDAKFPNAPSHVKQRAGMERRRAGCN